MKRRDLERHLREHGCRLVDETGTANGPPPEGLRAPLCLATARSTSGLPERSANSSTSRHPPDLADVTVLLLALRALSPHRGPAARWRSMRRAARLRSSRLSLPQQCSRGALLDVMRPLANGYAAALRARRIFFGGDRLSVAVEEATRLASASVEANASCGRLAKIDRMTVVVCDLDERRRVARFARSAVPPPGIEPGTFGLRVRCSAS